MCVLNYYSCVQLFVTLWSVAHQAPLSIWILQARILDWVAMSSSKGSSQPRERTQVSLIAGNSSSFKPPGLVISRMLSQALKDSTIFLMFQLGNNLQGWVTLLKPPFSSLLGPSSLIPVLAVGFEMNPETHSEAKRNLKFKGVRFSSVAQSCPTLCNLMNRSTPGLPVHHQFPEATQTYVH